MNREPRSPLPAKPFHYGWVIVGTGTLIIMACLGFGRFALGMLLPSMGHSLGLDYAQMGFISTGNFIGYLGAVFLSGLLTAQLGARRLIAAGLSLVALSMMAVSQAQSFAQVLLLYFITGFGAGTANVPIMALIAHWFERSLRGRAAGFIVSGSGFAIVFSGWMIPAINDRIGPEGWRWSWLVLGGLALAITVIATVLIRNRPAEMGLSPHGSKARGTAAAPGNGPQAPPPDLPAAYGRRMTTHLGLVYFLFGFTYVIYTTFIVTALVQERGFSEASAGQFWMWVGAISILSGPLFGGLSDRTGRKIALMIVFAMHTAAYLLVALRLPDVFAYLSIFLWAIGVWSVPSIMTAAVGDYLGAERAAAAFGTVTLFFGLGQIVGPGLAGVLADFTGSFAWSFALAAAMTALAVVLSAAMRRPA
ncbi:MAG: MFS transporter [Xanthomonadales bacterium]|nr:MFS transporter [Xanthomonadales bacterium]